MTILHSAVYTNLLLSKDADSTEFTPKIKLSENTEKVTNPGNKTVYRLYSKINRQDQSRSYLPC